MYWSWIHSPKIDGSSCILPPLVILPTTSTLHVRGAQSTGDGLPRGDLLYSLLESTLSKSSDTSGGTRTTSRGLADFGAKLHARTLSKTSGNYTRP